MARNVEDVAIILNYVTSSFLQGHRKPHNYTDFLTKDALRHSRIGIERRLFRHEFLFDPSILPVVEDAIDALRRAGATIIDPVDTGDPFNWFDPEFTVLLFEFKHDIRAYLSTLRNTSMHTLADLIRFNRNHCEREMKYFGQEVFEAAEATSGDLSDPEYLKARRICIRLGREQGIDRVMREHNLDAVLSPSFGSGSSAPAIAGYPVCCTPVGFTNSGKPVGVYLYAGFLEEPKLLKVAYGIEQLLQVHRPPHFAGHVPPPPPDAGICSSSAAEAAPQSGGAGRSLPTTRHGVRMIHALY